MLVETDDIPTNGLSSCPSACVAHASCPWARPIRRFKPLLPHLVCRRCGEEAKQTTATAFYHSPYVRVARVPVLLRRVTILMCGMSASYSVHTNRPSLHLSSPFYGILAACILHSTRRCAVRRKIISPSHPSWHLASAPASSPFSQPLRLQVAERVARSSG